MKRYEPQTIEPKWQAIWEETGLFKAPDQPKDKAYIIPMFPYPSGDGLHVGHPRPYTAADITSHFARYHGKDVLHATGWDAFGLPAENAAIKKGVHPAENTAKNIENFRRQLKMLGISYDWDREVNTSDPSYYKWTQWIFLQLFKVGLAYRGEGWQWWCPKDKTVLANEQVIDGKCERCGSEVTKKRLTQWYFKVTDYAEELLDNLEQLDWPESIKALQRNWIGRSEGLLFESPVKDTKLKVQTFSAHFEAFYADTFVVIAPDHPRLPELLEGMENRKQIEVFCEHLLKKRIKQGFEAEKEHEGIFTGRYIEDPVGNGDLPIWVASYALADYGTGIVKCSAHDERDFAFAKKYDIPLKAVLLPPEPKLRKRVENFEVCYADFEEGTLTEPKELAGQRAHGVSEQIKDYAEKKKLAKRQTQYRLRDWLISRQRYWGTPIPIVHCRECGTVPVPEDQLPVELPDVKDYLPTGDGRSPLAKVTSFVETTCPKCGGTAERETDTMDTFADSSWYFLRYPDISDAEHPWNPQAVKTWCPVDTYVGGADHAVLHLIYARFWTMALADLKHVSFREPFLSLRNHGMIHAEDGDKMSKSKGNVVNPDEIVTAFGADAFRVFEMFIGPYDQAASWSTRGLEGVYRFMGRVWRFGQEVSETAPGAVDGIAQTVVDRAVAKAIRNVTRSIEQFRFNTAVSSLMEALNELYRLRAESPQADFREAWERYLILLSPLAPHIAEELWHELGNQESIFRQSWPSFDPELVAEDTVTVVVQINGNVRASLLVAADTDEAAVTKLATEQENVAKQLAGKPVKKTIYVPGKILNLVV